MQSENFRGWGHGEDADFFVVLFLTLLTGDNFDVVHCAVETLATKYAFNLGWVATRAVNK